MAVDVDAVKAEELAKEKHKTSSAPVELELKSN